MQPIPDRPIPDRLVVLTFDDGRRSDVELVGPLLKRHGFGATFYVTEGLGFEDKGRFLDWHEIKWLHEAGFEIGNHHGRHVAVDTQTREEFVRDLRHMEQSCLAHGIAKPLTYCYPGGHHSRVAVEALHDAGYLFARRCTSPEHIDHAEGAFGRTYVPGEDHPLLIPVAGIGGASWDLGDLCAAVSNASDGTIAVICLHGVPDDHAFCSTEPALFERFVTYLADNDYTVIALRDLARYVDPWERPADPYAPISARLGVQARELTCEYAADPLGLQAAQPRFNWLLASDQRDQRQTACQILVASRRELLQPGRADRWDSGTVEAADTVHVAYEGQVLTSGETCYWTVRCWDAGGRAGPWAAPARFEMGLLDAGDWKGDWIGAGSEAGVGSGAPLLRREFGLSGAVRRARLYAAGPGFCELYVNGTRLGDAVLDPAPTDYDKRVLYVTHDVTGLLRPGANAVGAMLGNGWYSEPSAHRYGNSPRLLLQLDVELKDGSTVAVVSDGAWQASAGPITANDLWNGETYDATREQRGWTEPRFDAAGWQPAAIKSAPGGTLESQTMPPMKVIRTMPAVTVTNPRDGVWMFDFGQLFGGWARLRVRGERGDAVTISYSARLDRATGLLDRRHQIRGSESDTYLLRGGGEECYQPRFTWHPVRYVQVTGYPGRPAADALVGCVVHSAVDLSQSFSCSEPLLEQIYRNARWTFTNGLFGIPLDCLHREHWGWNDPGTVISTLYGRAFMPQFWRKWLDDSRLAQNDEGVIPDIAPAYRPSGGSRNNPIARTGDPAWAGNYPLLVWYLYRYFADRRLLETHYPAMRRWIDSLTQVASDDLMMIGHYGDHLPPGSAPGGEEFISSETPPPLLWTGYYYRGAAVVAQVAEELGAGEDARAYGALAERIRDALNRRWLDAERGVYASGSQTANAFALALDIVPEAHRERVVAALVETIEGEHDGHLHAGNVGVSAMIEALPRLGRGELLQRMAMQTTYPGWGYMVAQGATTIWEGWSLEWIAASEDSMMMFAGITELFWGTLLGIEGPDYYGPRATAPGFDEVRIRPRLLGELTRAEGSIRTVRGRIAVGWERAEEGLTLKVTLPAGMRGRVTVPTLGLPAYRIDEHGAPVWRHGTTRAPRPWAVDGVGAAVEDADGVTFELGSGDYRFAVNCLEADQVNPRRR